MWPIALALFLLCGFFAGGMASADIDNTAQVVANYGGAQVSSELDLVNVDVDASDTRVQLTKIITNVSDENNNGRTDTGDIVTYGFTVTNVGAVTLETLTVSDATIGFTSEAVGPLSPGEDDISITASYTLLQSDIDAGGFENSASVTAAPVATGEGGTRPEVGDISDAGDEAVETAALDGATDEDPSNDPTVLEIERIAALALQKSLVNQEFVFPYVFDLTYTIDVTNTGSITSANLQVTDDLATAMSPATLVSVAPVTFTDFAGNGTINTAFDGQADVNTLSGDVQLAPDATGSITLMARVNLSAGMPETGNTAYGTTTDITTPVASNDATITPDDPDDTNPTPYIPTDADGDGAFDGYESDTADRDGDGIVDSADYDPTGYFYCEETGDILSGGFVSVTGSAGTQSGVGSNANIVIVQDGSTGYFLWYATAAGQYTMTYDLPTTGVASTDRVAGGMLDLTGLLPVNPAQIGSNEFGTSGTLADFTAGTNPFYVEFDIEAGDPSIHNNNIPLKNCGTPLLAVEKSVLNSELRTDGRFDLSYSVTLRNDGETTANNVMISDDLATVFGAGNIEIKSVALTNAPSGFAASANSNFNGVDDQSLLTTGGALNPEDEVTVTFSSIITLERSDDYNNIAVATGTHPLDGSALDEATGEAEIGLVLPPASENETFINAEKSASTDEAQVGDTITYTMTFANTYNFSVTDIDLVDLLPEGMAYTPGTATLDGFAVEPRRDGRRLTWSGVTILPKATVIIKIDARVGPGVEGPEFVNQTWAAQHGNMASNVATAAVRFGYEPVFDCADVIGKVFDDKNANGYQDERTDAMDEDGLSNIRLSTATGTIITTDSYGRYSVPCAELPRETGANFTLKLDERSLPAGFHLTTENPRTMRLTAGHFTEMNFGATEGRVIDLDLTATAFDGDNEPVERLEQGLLALFQKLGHQPVTINLTYFGDGESRALARQRIDAVEDLIDDQTRRLGYRGIHVEREILGQ